MEVEVDVDWEEEEEEEEGTGRITLNEEGFIQDWILSSTTDVGDAWYSIFDESPSTVFASGVTGAGIAGTEEGTFSLPVGDMQLFLEMEEAEALVEEKDEVQEEAKEEEWPFGVDGLFVCWTPSPSSHIWEPIEPLSLFDESDAIFDSYSESCISFSTCPTSFDSSVGSLTWVSCLSSYLQIGDIDKLARTS